ncbi:MutS family DNA mismatch repair protein [Staphylococcus epidermidis]|uniref:MutS-related protein n=1 Tax=Staphylococcus epidermidis TaxID=1282 RepID=UPI00193BCE17|nr:MutS family DNA mismatch repair protein [Staphylococcus epidermidis]MBM6128271.1 MutS family DNA mismatch repair protein [Staphylococcus epidermidis]MBM6135007.1 MutS family DNA mismatch repair protein [Staphylococcus epidermidis]MBM6137240.1 MutS family DNA mismatch repair protein [Staphylococcus epidermidis]MBM6141915.1 MutS family DNA mismatch repair protein [Staphylococcus epidermidis]MBM6144144.1 MutS family DNA mismatch repair protein [Staphylococcus epidermidis]
MTNNQTLVLIILTFIILITLVNVIISIIERRKQIAKINTLWDNKLKLESFIRPNSRFDAQYHAYRDHYNEQSFIDDKTWSDLNMDTLFHKINFNFTAIGEMRLYATLRGMFKVNQTSLINKFKDNKVFRLNVSYILSKIGKNVYPLFPDQMLPTKRNILLMFCPLLPFIGFAFIFLIPSKGILICLTFMILNAILSFKLKKSYGQDLKSIFYTANVIKQSQALSKIESTPAISVDFTHFKASRRFSGLLARVESQDMASSIIMFIKLVFMIDYVLFHLIQRSYFKYQEEVMACYDYISILDNHYSIAMYQHTLTHYCNPKINHNMNGLQMKSIIHPLLDEENAIANTIDISNHILLTGSNASGKSTFMKAVALNLILAQSIQTATAHSFIYQPGYVMTSMANADDVLSGDSYFMSELKSIRRLFNTHQCNKIYCFIDEIFKGTNTTERIAASESVLSYLDNQKAYQVLAATHDVELSTLLENTYNNYHFNESIQENSIFFDYKIKPGKANTRNAIELLRITQFPIDIYQRAQQNIRNL